MHTISFLIFLCLFLSQGNLPAANIQHRHQKAPTIILHKLSLILHLSAITFHFLSLMLHPKDTEGIQGQIQA
ncbi:hypothetical protein DW182_14530 [Bacteroides sp. AM16-24]|nr:hypothetical protein DW182_14530 [Bacteroides sp. AM16-24]